MFTLSYKIFKNIEENELLGADGYLQLQIEDEAYGILIPEEVDEFSVSIYWWTRYLLEALLILKTESYVLISDTEKPNIWLELKKEKHLLKISKVSADKPDGSGAVQRKEMPNLIYPFWKDKQVTYNDFKNEILKKATLYTKELRQLNSEEKKDVLILESLILEIDK